MMYEKEINVVEAIDRVECRRMEERKAVKNKEKEFVVEMSRLINRFCYERPSNTPDFILAEYLLSCLKAYDTAVVANRKWHSTGAEVVEAPHGLT